MKRILILVLPIVLVALVEVVLRFGAWDSLAEPRSHAGLSVRLKNYLESSALEKTDFVTLGSSRPQHGIDHDQLAAIAARHGKSHVNMSMPGVHWMSVGVLTDWLQDHHPEIQGGIIALSIQDFSSAGNGSYELEIIQPFRKLGDHSWVEAHVPFDLDHPDSWGSRFSLMAWREDIRDFIQHPFKRLNRARKVARDADPESLFGNQSLAGSMCTTGIKTIAACDKLENTQQADSGLLAQCRQIRSELANRPDFTAMLRQKNLPVSMRKIQDLIQLQLRNIKWNKPPIVVLMPLPPIWRTGAGGEALHQWALDVLQPLQNEGTIHIVDATAFFDGVPEEGCDQFADFYHQNAEGRRAFSAWLMPQVESLLYVEPASQIQ